MPHDAVFEGHALHEPPSFWICWFAALIRNGGEVLDLASGKGRHALWLAALGHRVEAVDRDEAALSHLCGIANVAAVTADLESGAWPYAGRKFDGVVVSRYLHRPLLPLLADLLHPQGVLIYETFMVGNERFGKPSNPDFLLRTNELLDVFAPRLKVVAFEQGQVSRPKAAEIQRICAINAEI